MKKFISFGKIKLDDLIRRLFLFGIVPIALYSYIFIKYFIVTISTNNIIQQSNSENTLSAVSVQLRGNPATGLYLLIISFVSGVILWKLTCEIIYIILKYFKNNTAADINE